LRPSRPFPVLQLRCYGEPVFHGPVRHGCAGRSAVPFSKAGDCCLKIVLV
jgi:hypothetical protein